MSSFDGSNYELSDLIYVENKVFQATVNIMHSGSTFASKDIMLVSYYIPDYQITVRAPSLVAAYQLAKTELIKCLERDANRKHDESMDKSHTKNDMEEKNAT